MTSISQSVRRKALGIYRWHPGSKAAFVTYTSLIHCTPVFRDTSLQGLLHSSSALLNDGHDIAVTCYAC